MAPKKKASEESNSTKIKDDQYDKCERMLTEILQLQEIISPSHPLHMSEEEIAFIKDHIMSSDYPDSLSLWARYHLRVIVDNLAQALDLRDQSDWTISRRPLKVRMDMVLTGIEVTAASVTSAILKAKIMVQKGDPSAAEGSDIHSFSKLPTNQLHSRISLSFILIVGFTLGFQKWPNSDSFVYVAKSYNLMRVCETTFFDLVRELNLSDDDSAPIMAFNNRIPEAGEPGLSSAALAHQQAAAAEVEVNADDLLLDDDDTDAEQTVAAGGRSSASGSLKDMLLRALAYKAWYDVCKATESFNASSLQNHLVDAVKQYNKFVNSHWRTKTNLQTIPEDVGVRWLLNKTSGWLRNMNAKTKQHIEELSQVDYSSETLPDDLFQPKKRKLLERYWQFHIMRIKTGIGGKKRVREEEGQSESATKRRLRLARVTANPKNGVIAIDGDSTDDGGAGEDGGVISLQSLVRNVRNNCHRYSYIVHGLFAFPISTITALPSVHALFLQQQVK